MRNIFIKIVAVMALVATIGYAKVLTAKTVPFMPREYNKNVHGWLSLCLQPEVTVKYNPVTDRGRVTFGRECTDSDWKWAVWVRAYDADGFQINAFEVRDLFSPHSSFHIMGTTLTEDERKAVKTIAIDFFDGTGEEYIGRGKLDCPAGRVESDNDEILCERICPDDKIYDKYTDKCINLYDSKETAAYEPPDERVDTPVADVSSYWPGYGPDNSGYDTDNYKTDGNTYYDQWKREQWRPEPDSDCPTNNMIGGRCMD